MRQLHFYLTALCFLSFVFSLIGQHQIGFRAGAGFNQTSESPFLLQISTAPDYSLRPMVGPFIAMHGALNLSGHWFLQLEAQLMQKGTRAEEDIIFTNNSGQVVLQTQSYTYKADYVEVPLLLKYQLGDGNFKPAIFAGPSLGYAIDQRLKGNDLLFSVYNNNIMVFDPRPQNRLDWDDSYEADQTIQNRWDIGFQIGMDIRKKLWGQTFFLDLRYIHDTTDWREYQMDSGEYKEVKNRSLVASLGIDF